MGVEDGHIVGDRQLIDLIEADPAPAQWPAERPCVAGDDAFAPAHAHAHDVHELGILGEELAQGFGVLRVQRRLKGIDDPSRAAESRNRVLLASRWSSRAMMVRIGRRSPNLTDASCSVVLGAA
jgi:hypothetical protein